MVVNISNITEDKRKLFVFWKFNAMEVSQYGG